MKGEIGEDAASSEGGGGVNALGNAPRMSSASSIQGLVSPGGTSGGQAGPGRGVERGGGERWRQWRRRFLFEAPWKPNI